MYADNRPWAERLAGGRRGHVHGNIGLAAAMIPSARGATSLVVIGGDSNITKSRHPDLWFSSQRERD